ncbi:MAG: arginine--tRNA ligase, partial [Actinobacteria bacterium]|nr:arginine--tRNA ligase [Actinomycetota bacterium]
MTPAELRRAVVATVAASVADGEFAGNAPDDVVLERPKSRNHGDYATNIAMRLARAAGKPPREIADLLAARLSSVRGVAAVEVAGPGFLNITLDTGSLGALARHVVDAGEQYGRGEAYAGRQINLEFVSANPTGPVHLGGTRWAAVGDALARVLQAQGATVVREYYFNDHGAQIDRFARSLLARAQGRAVPEDGYAGEYIDEIARRVLADHPGVLDRSADQAQEVFRAEGVALMFDEVKREL